MIKHMNFILLATAITADAFMTLRLKVSGRGAKIILWQFIFCLESG